jgi:hypothetical protein
MFISACSRARVVGSESWGPRWYPVDGLAHRLGVGVSACEQASQSKRPARHAAYDAPGALPRVGKHAATRFLRDRASSHRHARSRMARQAPLATVREDWSVVQDPGHSCSGCSASRSVAADPGWETSAAARLGAAAPARDSSLASQGCQAI